MAEQESSPVANLRKILDLAGLEFDEISAEVDGETTNLDISSSDHARIFGRGGRTLAAIEHLLRAILFREEFSGFVNLDLNGLRKKELDSIRQLARETAQKVLDSGENQKLPKLPADLRRIAHLVLTEEFPQLKSESLGDGREKEILLSGGS
jgi:spoIIIJ-associated protein